jgi:hypothetical protein
MFGNKMIFVLKMQCCACDDGAETGYKRLIPNGLNMKTSCRHDLASDINNVQMTMCRLKI